ncbi:alcohol dehydrogenase [Burkholderia sp. HI2714]|uniref:zinc-binding dehydrogenase n=1 Tax=Burkholderia sp. HI2714 TaxID=2015359 RepID=UPI000B7A7DB5|nr:zinc-binding dehydrogenase [Burkholderia sp. HI2714]OXJ30534.1 alcohol dehydrogenase [Burkholderia sp. HI2714]
MKAYVIERFGGPDVLQLLDIPQREPGSGEVRIRVRAFGLNRVETHLRAGKLGSNDQAYRVPGIEAVGEVLNDPSGLFHTGQAVATAMGGLQFTRPGSYAEEVTVQRSNVIALDGSMLSWAELAALPGAYITAIGALDKMLASARGQTLLIRGGTSSVGLAAIAYAKFRGVTVIATSREAANLQRMRDVGADLALLDDGQIASAVKAVVPSGVDAVFEAVGASTLRDSARALRQFGMLSIVGLHGGTELESFHLMKDLPNGVRLGFFSSALFGTSAMPAADVPLLAIARATADGDIPSLRTHTLDFDELRRAHCLMESNRALGKIVVTI